MATGLDRARGTGGADRGIGAQPRMRSSGGRASNALTARTAAAASAGNTATQVTVARLIASARVAR